MRIVQHLEKYKHKQYSHYNCVHTHRPVVAIVPSVAISHVVAVVLESVRPLVVLIVVN